MANILIFSAHPDDAEFGMGGTFLKLAKKHKVVNIVLTRGEAGTHGTPELRVKEAEAAAKFAKAKVEFLDFIDNKIEINSDNAHKLAQVIRNYRPEIILTPYHTNNFSHRDGVAHPDHTATGSLTRMAARFAKFKNADLTGKPHNAERLIYYMIPKYSKPSFIIDVSNQVKDMKKLWQCHSSQLKLRKGKLSDFLLLWRRMHGLLNNVEYAEVFISEEPLHVDPFSKV